ncbi:hypothetical protein K2173_007055 [Erythroxylum novogranatense]|uniref:Uncharacterized protein n=1 Tax=Erythroxylum novogranatense TaxID=1862640 RepID=A0AAV8SLH0_9ROSI|nr:hypothetical protein K2173_007055 [Erythroxylum novogranatense]
MSTSSRSDIDNSFDVDELLRIELRCKELRKEKDELRDSQSQSFELIKRLEQHVNSLSEAHIHDRKHIQQLERELLNCFQEIDYLQDQLNARNAVAYGLEEHAHDLELKLAGLENLQAKVGHLEEELNKSNSDCLSLKKELESKELELQKSAWCIEKLEESFSSLTLDSQCEIESMKLDIITLEQTCFEVKKLLEETTKENARMIGLIKELESHICDDGGVIESLGKENTKLMDKLFNSEVSCRLFLQKIEDCLENRDRAHLDPSFLCELENKDNISTEMREVMCSIISKLASSLAQESNLEDLMESMSRQISEYEILIKQHKEELKVEKLKAKEETEDLAQEMAELRYKMTSLLEEECKRRAVIEQASLQRIAELEAQIQKDKKTSFASIRNLNKV